jgi:hypothetical protein
MIGEYNELRLRGNPVAAFAVLRRNPPSPREQPADVRLVLTPKPGPHVQDLLGRRLEYKSEPEYHRALRMAARADQEEIATQTEITTEVELCD